MTISELHAMPAAATNRVDNQDRARRLAAVASGAVLLVASVAGLHHLYRDGDQLGELITWSVLLLGLFTALGGGIKLIMWGLRPVISAAFDAAKGRLSEPVQAVFASLAVIVGALGMWWSFRGGYSVWWQQITGEAGWSLILGVSQMLVAVIAGAALFTGGKYLFGLVREVVTGVDDAGAHRGQPQKEDESLWHPGLVAALVGGGLGLVLLTAGITPRLYVWITGPQILPAVGAIALVLLVAIGSNLGWWKGLGGLYKWATAASQKVTAAAGVIAVLMFSASGLGLGWFTPSTVPQAHAACPPDCGGPGGSDGPPGGGQMFQPPSQGGQQMPDYQGGINQPPMDQNGSVSIYNTQAPSVSNNGAHGSSGQQGPQQGWDQPAHGTQIPDYQNATPYTQGPGRPNPDFNGGQSNPGANAGSQGGQANQGAPQQQPPANQSSQQAPSQNANQQSPPQNQPPQQNTEQPNQSDQQRLDELMRQLQEQQQQSTQDRQRIDDLTKQLQQKNKPNQKQQQLPRFPSKDKKKDEDQQKDRDDQSQNTDLASLLLGAASSRRRKEDDPQQPQQQQKGPDTQALAQDGVQAAQGLPGDIQTYVQSGQQIGESSGQAAQGFGSAAQAGASLASSAQSGAVNPQDAITLVQGISQGVQGTADAINAGSQIVKTAQGEADQVAQAVGDANPQLEPQMDQARQLNKQAGQITDLVGQGSQLTSQGASAVNTVSSLGTSGMPDTSGATDALSGTATNVSQASQFKPIEFQSGPVPRDVPKPPPAPSNGSVQALDNGTPKPPPSPSPKPGESGFIGPVEVRGQGPTSSQIGNEYLNPSARPGHPTLWPDGSRAEMSQSGVLSIIGSDGNPLMPPRQIPLQAPTASSSELLDFGLGLSYSGDKTPVPGFAGITQRQLVDQYGVPQGKMSFNADGTPGVMDRGQMRVVDSNNKHQWFWPNGLAADQMRPGKTQPLLGDLDKDANFLANMIVPADAVTNLTHWEDISTGEKVISSAEVVFSVPGVGMVGKIGSKFYRLFKPAEEAANAVKPATEAATKTATGAINTATDTGGAASNMATRELSSGSKGNWTKELNKPAPNTKYVIDGKHTFMTDDLGRVTRVEGKIDSLAKADRNSYQQGVAGRGDRLPGDEGGHFIASMFGGPGEGINLTAMSANLNSKGAREFGQIEDEWRKIVERGGSVNPTFDVSYPENSLRPSQYVVSWIDQAGEMQQRFLSN
ncbi:DNA/RNA non-specific endonuclease [Mycobacteroides chelonae]|uniref:DNA/RNA non-specific endonuclease n=1 Tax=Mycobacteroides chelonae TaxID=1774 RepID=UPI003987151F